MRQLLKEIRHNPLLWLKEPSIETRPTTLLTTPMSDESIKSSKRVLEPNERISEVLFD